MRARIIVWVLVAAAVLLVLVPSAAGFYTDWLWFRELGYEGVFLKTLNAQAVLFAATFVVVFFFLYLNLRVARRSIARPQLVLGRGADGRPVVIEGRSLAKLAMPVALFVALGMALSGAGDWLNWLSFLHGSNFGDKDPLFGRDVAFYVFRLPILQAVRSQALLLCFLTLIGCGLLYVLSGSFILEPRYGVAFWPRVRLIPAARRHLALLGALIFGLMAWGAWLAMPAMLLAPATIIFGASYADVYARLPFLWATFAVLALGSAFSIWHGFGRRGWPVPVAIALYFVVSLTGGIYAAIVQNYIAAPNEQTKEQPFIISNIAATRRAYALDRVEEREMSGDRALSPQDIINNASTIENVRLWDAQPLLQTFAQIQEIRTYYDFVSVDNDRYLINGKLRQVMLSARELNTDSLPSRSWVNEHLQFTHGYGLTLGPVNQVMSDGTPVLFVKNLPPVVSREAANLGIQEPSIYFGELSSNYALVRTNAQEFHYPSGAANVTTTYKGSGGVPVGGFFRRLLFALRFGTTDILVTSQITSESRILYHRRIAERVKEIAPFLKFDTDPYPVVYDGRLFWIQDAYTTTTNYPYSTPTTYFNQDLNYIRNSVKISIDAYNGTTTLYLAEPDDPIAQTIGRIFPGLFRPISEMPAALRQHVRYPEDIFTIQSHIFATYHMTNPQVFYLKEDQWSVPALDGERNATPMSPYYTIMKLPSEKQAEFIQMLPFTPRLKDNLSAWMVARSDGPHYGRLLAFKFPKQKIIYGPKQIAGLINQDQLISPQITLWDQQGSKVIWGTLLVIPIEESLLYVRPLYLQSPDTKIPELKRVVVAYERQIVMMPTLSEALVQIFGRAVAAALPAERLEGTATSVTGVATPVSPDVTTEPTLIELAAEAKTHFDKALKAQQNGDWATYGEEIKAVQDLIEKMNKKK